MRKKATAPDEVTLVLDKIEAYYRVQRNGNKRRSTALVDLAHFLNKPYERPYEWVILRSHTPQIETFMRMQSWIKGRVARLSQKKRKGFKELLEIVIKQNRRNK